MKKYNIFLTFLICSIVTSCGFKPVYSSKKNFAVYAALSRIEISTIGSIEGAEFYNQLKNMLPHSNVIDYILDANLVFAANYTAIQQNSDTLRESVNCTVNYTFKEKISGKILTSGSFSRFSSYNTTFSPYSNIVLKQDILKNLAIMAAQEVRNRLIVYIEKQQK